MNKYIIIAKEETYREYVVEEIIAKDIKTATSKFNRMYIGDNIIIEESYLSEDSVYEEYEEGDYIEIINTESEDGEMLDEYLGAKGIVVEVDLDWEFPYSIEFVGDYEGLDEGILWKASNLKMI